ncbi:citrate lyase acyl carrier protein [Peptoniphilaceae bacterium SGI.137]
MEIHQMGVAGTLQSNDCMIRLLPAEKKEIILDSPVAYEFGDQIRNVVEKELAGAGLEKVRVEIEDKGALDCTIAARLQTAIRRAK